MLLNKHVMYQASEEQSVIFNDISVTFVQYRCVEKDGSKTHIFDLIQHSQSSKVDEVRLRKSVEPNEGRSDIIQPKLENQIEIE